MRWIAWLSCCSTAPGHGRVSLGFSALCAICLFAYASAPIADEGAKAEAAPEPPRAAEIAGLQAVLRDPSDDVVEVAGDYPRIAGVLPAVTDLAPNEIGRILAVWLRTPSPLRIDALAAHPALADAAASSVTRLLFSSTDEALKVAAVRFFRRNPKLADAALAGFEENHYYPNSLARQERSPATQAKAVVEAIPRIQGQIVLTGESGLGKTMFLRHLISKARRVTVNLPAWKCEGGVLEAIQQKLHGPAKDPGYLRTLIYAGAMDLCVDGVNEVGPDAREHIRAFAENLFKGNIIIGVQPIDWSPPSTAIPWVLEPLREGQIGELLCSRVPAEPGAMHLGDFHARCDAFVSEALARDQPADDREASRLVLSSPMDATVVAAMLARGETRRHCASD